MAVKAKRRTKLITLPYRNGSSANGSNGFHTREWQPGDPPELHPLYALAGSHKNDPHWEEYVELMKELRREELARDLEALDLEALKDQP